LEKKKKKKKVSQSVASNDKRERGRDFDDERSDR